MSRPASGARADVVRWVLVLALLASERVLADSMQSLLAEFANSDFVFQRSATNVPFPALAYVAYYDYGDLTLEQAGRKSSYDQSSVSQAAVLPWLVSERDMLFAGEWVARNRFQSNDSDRPSFAVTSVGIPLGWARQVNERWQAAAFLFPVGHESDLPGSDWSLEMMSGGFGRYIVSDRMWWGFGVFVDVTPGDDLYLPYIGFSRVLNDRWTVSAIMPWPALIYAPSANTSLRLGMSPAGTSWSVDASDSDVYYEWSGWNFGLGIQHRVHGNWWLEGELGVSGLHTLTYSEGDWSGISGSETPYVGVRLSWRPSGIAVDW